MFKQAIAIVLMAGAAVSGAVMGAKASTPGCTQGTYSGYCGTQTDQESGTPLSLDVFRQEAFSGNKIIGYPDSATDPAVDFYTFAFDGGNTKVFEYAPRGVASNLCVTEPTQLAGLVLERCTGSPSQQFTANAVGDTGTFTWTDKATGNVITVNGLRAQVTGDLAPPSADLPSSAQEFTFAG